MVMLSADSDMMCMMDRTIYENVSSSTHIPICILVI